MNRKSSKELVQAKDAKEIQEGKVFAIISYLSILCLVALVLKRDNRFALFHAKQGLVLFISELAWIILLGALPFLGIIIKPLGILFFGLVSLWGILQALMGNHSRIILVSDIADKISI